MEIEESMRFDISYFNVVYLLNKGYDLKCTVLITYCYQFITDCLKLKVPVTDMENLPQFALVHLVKCMIAINKLNKTPITEDEIIIL